jgi:hypothetical protein
MEGKMSDPSNLVHFIVLLVIAIVCAYGVTLALVGTRKGRTIRVLLSSLVTVIFVHAYLILIGEGVDQFILISAIFVMIYGAVGSWLLDWLRTRFLQGKA